MQSNTLNGSGTFVFVKTCQSNELAKFSSPLTVSTLVECLFKIFFFASALCKIGLAISDQSHYREVPRWGVSNGARHNWKCFLAYKKLSYTFDKSKCATNYRDIFDVDDGLFHLHSR